MLLGVSDTLEVGKRLLPLRHQLIYRRRRARQFLQCEQTLGDLVEAEHEVAREHERTLAHVEVGPPSLPPELPFDRLLAVEVQRADVFRRGAGFLRRPHRRSYLVAVLATDGTGFALRGPYVGARLGERGERNSGLLQAIDDVPAQILDVAGILLGQTVECCAWVADL